MNRKLIAATLVTGLGLSFLTAEGAITVTTNETDHTVTIDVPSGSDVNVTDVYGAETAKLIKDGDGTMRYLPSGETPYGGLEIKNGMVVVKDGRHVGVGPIVTATDGTLYICDADVVLTNKVTFGGAAGRVAAYTDKSATGAGCVTLTSVCSTEKVDGFRRVLIGRGSGGKSKEVLSLGADSEAFDRLDVDGSAQVTFDGGTFRIPATAANPFVRLTSNGTKSFFVSSQGVTFDTAEGVDVSLGVSPSFAGAAKATNCVESVVVEKGSFEGSSSTSATNGWTITENTYGETSKRGSLTTGFVTGTRDGVERTWMTPFGDYYFHLRRGASLEREVTIPKDGLWRLSYWCGCRPPTKDSTAYSQKIAATVFIDDRIVQTVPALTSKEELHEFKEFKTDATWLETGTHVIKIVHSDSPYGSGGKNYDYFVLERCEETIAADGPLAKKGVGRLTVDGIVTPSPVAVEAGSLFLTGTTLDGSAATVADGATLELAVPTLTEGAKVTVAAGGTLVLRDDTDANLVSSGSFEAPTTSDFKKSAPTGWTRSLTDDSGTYNNTDGAGYCSDSSSNLKAAEKAPDGNQTAYLRNYTKLEQTVNAAAAGTYRLSFRQAVRTGSFNSHKLCVHARIDGAEVVAAGPFADEPNYGYKAFAATVELSAGEHVLSFDVTGDVKTQGAIVYIDLVKLVPYVGVRDIDVGELHLASGSTLKLDYDGKMHVQNVFVDDVKVNGGKSALVNAGVTVSGPGLLSVGDKLGFMILMR